MRVLDDSKVYQWPKMAYLRCSVSKFPLLLLVNCAYQLCDLYRFIPIDSTGRGYVFVIVSNQFDIFVTNIKSLLSVFINLLALYEWISYGNYILGDSQSEMVGSTRATSGFVGRSGIY